MNETFKTFEWVSAGELRKATPSATENMIRRKKREKLLARFIEWSSILHSKGYTRVHEINNIMWKAICDEHYHAQSNGLLGQSSMIGEKFINDFIDNLPTWKSMKKIIFERDQNKCTRCGSKKYLEAHHLKQVRFGGLPSEKNLVTLCRSCHKDEGRA
jgi:hypothetical protein